MSLWRRLRLTVEVILLYVMVPIGLYDLVYIERMPLLQVLPYALGVLLLLLVLERQRGWFNAYITFPRLWDIISIVLLFLVCGSALALYARETFPGNFLSFPERAPDLWRRIMILYPAISVTTQETFFRVFFFQRYAPLFGERQWIAILVNAVLFAFAHAVLFAYRHTPFHWEAVAISFAGGLIFAYRFSRTRSFWAVALEHSLYGDLIFTVGLGVFFYTGVSNV